MSDDDDFTQAYVISTGGEIEFNAEDLEFKVDATGQLLVLANGHPAGLFADQRWIGWYKLGPHPERSRPKPFKKEI